MSKSELLTRADNIKRFGLDLVRMLRFYDAGSSLADDDAAEIICICDLICDECSEIRQTLISGGVFFG